MPGMGMEIVGGDSEFLHDLSRKADEEFSFDKAGLFGKFHVHEKTPY